MSETLPLAPVTLPLTTVTLPVAFPAPVTVLSQREIAMAEMADEVGFDIAYDANNSVGNPAREGEPWWTWHDIGRVLPQRDRLNIIRWVEIFGLPELQLGGSVLVFIPCNRLRRKIFDGLDALNSHSTASTIDDA